MLLDQDVESWSAVRDVLNAHEMPPPEEENQPSEHERQQIVDWIDTSFEQVAENYSPSKIRLVKALMYTGLRLEDIAGLRVKHLQDIDEPFKAYIKLEDTKNKSVPLVELPLSLQAVSVFQEQLATLKDAEKQPDSFVFPNSKNKSHKSGALEPLYKKITKMTGLPKYTSHSLRKCFIMVGETQELNLKTLDVKRLTLHVDADVQSRHYNIARTEVLRAATNTIGQAIDNLCSVTTDIELPPKLSLIHI